MADPYYLPSLAHGTTYATSPIGTSAVTSGLNTAGAGISSVLGPLGAMWNLHNLLKNVTNNDAQRAQYEAEYRAALEELQQAGFDPNQVFSQEAVQGMLDAAPAFQGLPGYDPAALSQDLIGSTVWDYFNDPSRYSTVTGANQLAATPNPVDYGRDVVDTIGDIWNDPSSLIGIILGPGGVTGNVEWGGGTIDNAPGSNPAIYTGKIGDKVYTGVSTGIPVVDAAIRRVLGQTEGGETTTWDVVTAAVEAATGYPASTVSDILEDVFTESGPSLPSPGPTTPTSGTPSTTTTTPQDQTDKVTVGADGDLVEKVLQILRGDKSDAQIRAEAEAAGVTPEDIAKVSGLPQDEVDSRWENAGSSTPGADTTTGSVLEDTTTGSVLEDTVGGSVLEDTTTGSVLEDTVGGSVLEDTTTGSVLEDTVGGSVLEDTVGGSVLETTVGGNVLEDTVGGNILQDTVGGNISDDTIGSNVLEDTVGGNILEDVTEGVIDTTTGGGGSGSSSIGDLLDMLGGGGGGMRGVNVKPGELVDIKYVLDMLSGQRMPTSGINPLVSPYAGGYRMPYYSAGGEVSPDTIDEILALLRG